jgi:DNA polymerase-1
VLVRKYGMDPSEVDRVWNDYFRAMPEIKYIQKRMDVAMRTRGYMLTLLRRRCRLEHPDRSYVALNRILQGGNADLVKKAMVEIDDYLASEGRPIDMINSVHDALDFQFAEEHRPVFQRCLDIMTGIGDQFKIDVPITVDVGEGNSWAEATFGEEHE